METINFSETISFTWVKPVEEKQQNNHKNFQCQLEFLNSKGDTHTYTTTYFPNDESTTIQDVEKILNRNIQKLIQLVRVSHMGVENGPRALILEGAKLNIIKGKFYDRQGQPYEVNILQQLQQREKHLAARKEIFIKHKMDDRVIVIDQQIERIKYQIHTISTILQITSDQQIETTEKSPRLEIAELIKAEEMHKPFKELIGEVHLFLKRRLADLFLQQKITLYERNKVYDAIDDFMDEMRQKSARREKVEWDTIRPILEKNLHQPEIDEFCETIAMLVHSITAPPLPLKIKVEKPKKVELNELEILEFELRPFFITQETREQMHELIQKGSEEEIRAFVMQNTAIANRSQIEELFTHFFKKEV